MVYLPEASELKSSEIFSNCGSNCGTVSGSFQQISPLPLISEPKRLSTSASSGMFPLVGIGPRVLPRNLSAVLNVDLRTLTSDRCP
jgi:hypothetical protein